MKLKDLISTYEQYAESLKQEVYPYKNKQEYSKIYKQQIIINSIEKFIIDLKKLETEESLINVFIGKINNDTYNKIRHSNTDSECRRYLKNIINE